jgi:DNA processing protein
VDGATLTVMTSGVERCTPAVCEPLYRRILESGCAISESHSGGRARRWWRYSCLRTLALLAQLVIVVEAEDQSSELACASVASSRGRCVGAVPGRVNSPTSEGTHSLLTGGARLIRGAQDALDALYGVGVREVVSDRGPVVIEPHLEKVLKRVSGGEDTLAKLMAGGSHSDEVVVALAELELLGLLSRGDGGRYLPSSRARRCALHGPSPGDGA